MLCLGMESAGKRGEGVREERGWKVPELDRGWPGSGGVTPTGPDKGRAGWGRGLSPGPACPRGLSFFQDIFSNNTSVPQEFERKITI